MSKISTKPFKCPSCGYEGKFTMYDSVNVTLDPNLREKVLSGEVFDWVCPKCKEQLSIRHNLLYHDMDRKFQIYYAPNNCEAVCQMMNDMMTKYPGMRSKCRTVESLNALREKVYVFETGLDDIAIELAKAVMKYSKDNSIPENCELRFEKILQVNESAPFKLLFRQIIEGHPQEGMILYDKSNYDNFLHEVTTNAAYKMEKFCDTINEDWIIQRLTKK